ncbi:hypothetical protein EJ05DRAFT_6920 [Pseudovirgaria hyperparasitica]|uniref:Uncharacterized protein n=1 Tax=Pseudovirgaria hyperparasitica TaxID=470096 RepID=A0A6A6WK94_9PEZI|nr:uncharacterized protein EJ05DRAFT_6920 [Pseudovirgaria hyperparasitica]KAF2762582.1 hypothetical protein EJ05DRAFT_6920 [Pseudovirgaria hyperparasitica]
MDAPVDCALVSVLLAIAKKLDRSVFPVYRPIHIYVPPRDDAVVLRTRTSRLLGMVEEEWKSRIAGFLLTYIDCGYKTLFCAGRDPESGLATRKKWAQQIAHSAHELHTH